MSEVSKDSRAKWANLTAPDASTTTSSTLSDNRSNSAPTMLFAWKSRLVAGSFCIKLQIAAQAHVLSAYSADLSYEHSDQHRLKYCQYPDNPPC